MPSGGRRVKDQYFGDINDYRKYGLLRVLQQQARLTILVAWMLTPADGSRDGGRRKYLDRPDKWRHYDPELFDGLVRLLRDPVKPGVSLIERSSLLQNTTFYSEMVPDSRQERERWRSGLVDAARGVDLVFLDPDNGIEVPSRPIGRKGSSKYVAWDELLSLWRLGRSLLIYQHFPKRPHKEFAQAIASKLRYRTRAPLVKALRTANVVFLLACQESHRRHIQTAVSSLLTRWGGQFVDEA